MATKMALAFLGLAGALLSGSASMTHIESTTQHGKMNTHAVADPGGGGGGVGGSTPPPRFFFACQYMKLLVDLDPIIPPPEEFRPRTPPPRRIPRSAPDMDF